MFEKDENKQKEAGVAHSKKSFSVEGGSNPVGFNKIVPKNNSSFRLLFQAKKQYLSKFLKYLFSIKKMSNFAFFNGLLFLSHVQKSNFE